ncbi:hypothetical protein [Sinosporangium siamense]|uniref:Uncharacterized protein n=1 Tax=Sinosporangium siamense TaxID=1367973 RepID=A0A919RP17_9ACTN|nr:hypothetical protein [Sinosporangium siamense]GII96657.1 hypothetical protein Ssi02_68880 [Sinosporangium siamense]
MRHTCSQVSGLAVHGPPAWNRSRRASRSRRAVSPLEVERQAGFGVAAQRGAVGLVQPLDILPLVNEGEDVKG